MSYKPPLPFLKSWQECSYVVIDVETTGLRPGIDGACQVAVARFENGELLESASSLTHPGLPIPAEATAIHGITDEMVSGAPSIDDFFHEERVSRLCVDAQPCGYNSGYDRCFTPAFAFDHAWPWLDILALVRHVDAYAKGPGRHKLEASCARHGVELKIAHNAEADAIAAGELMFKLIPKVFDGTHDREPVGDVLYWCRQSANNEWHRFHSWLAKQPERA